MYRRAGDSGHGLSLSKLGNFSLKGKGMMRNEQQAVKYFERADKVGEPRATYQLAKMAKRGRAMPRSLKRRLSCMSVHLRRILLRLNLSLEILI